MIAIENEVNDSQPCKKGSVMNSQRMRTIAIVTVVISALGASAMSAQDKYTVKVPGGLAFSEFRGYESWQTISVSQNGELIAAILAQSRDDRRLQGRHSRQRQAVPRRRQDGEDPLDAEEDGDVPGSDGAGRPCMTSTSW